VISLLARYRTNCLWKISPDWQLKYGWGQSWTDYRIWGQKVNGQCHSETKYGQKTLRGISYKVLFVGYHQIYNSELRCSWGQRWTDYGQRPVSRLNFPAKALYRPKYDRRSAVERLVSLTTVLYYSDFQHTELLPVMRSSSLAGLLFRHTGCWQSPLCCSDPTKHVRRTRFLDALEGRSTWCR